MEATTTVCLSFVIQIKSRRDRATMKTPLKAPIRGTFVGEGGKAEVRARGSFRFWFQVQVGLSSTSFLFDSANVCLSLSSSPFLFSSFSSSSFSPPPRRTDRTMEPRWRNARQRVINNSWSTSGGTKSETFPANASERKTRAWNDFPCRSVLNDARLSGNFVECAIRKLEMSVI